MPEELVSRFLTLLERIAAQDPRVEFKKLSTQQAREFQVKEVWEAKASHKYRLFVSGMSRPMTILGFGHRGQNGLFRRER